MTDNSHETGMIASIRRLWPYVRPFRFRLLYALVLSGILTIVGLLPPLVMRKLVNDVGSGHKWELIPLLCSALFAITLFRAMMTFLNARTIAFVGHHTVSGIRKEVFSRLINLPVYFHQKTSTGALMQRTMGDAAAVQNLVTGHVITLIVDFITATYAISIMVWLSWQLTLVSFALLPVFYLNYTLFSGRIRANNIEMRGQMDHVSSLLQERLSTHDLIVNYSQEEESVQGFKDRVRASRDTALQGIAFNTGFNQATAFINGAGATIVYVAAVYMYLKGNIQYGDVVAFAAYSTQLMGPVVRFVRILQAANKSLVSINRVNEVFSEPFGVKIPPENKTNLESGKIVFRNVSYSNPETGEALLSNINLEIRSGEDLVLVGGSGSGKTAFLHSIRRMFDPDKGQIVIDGHDIRTFDSRLRRLAPVVRDSTAIFRGSIRGNLMYGRQDVDDKDLMKALEIVELHSFVSELSEGLDTSVGPGGIRLSAGQRQRLGIARAVVADPRIMIIDEGTAALDPGSASDLLESLFLHLPNTTILTAARRAGIAHVGNLIVVLEDGQVVQTGSHKKLMLQSDGAYRKLLEKQYGPIDPEWVTPRV